LLLADNNKAEGSGQPPSELFRSGELAFGSFGDEDAGEVSKQKQQSCTVQPEQYNTQVFYATAISCPASSSHALCVREVCLYAGRPQLHVACFVLAVLHAQQLQMQHT
jgi:hypothetical protein